jgi:hypothetical protein
MESNRVFKTVACVVIALAIGGYSASLAAQSGGALKVTSFPSGAKVAIDGVDTGKVTPMSVSLAVGDHAVIVSIPNSGWNADSRTVTIVSGNNDLSVTLLPVVTNGINGKDGLNGTNGTNGINGTSVTFSGYFGGNAHGCPNGGAIYTAGVVETYVCNGINASRADGPCFDYNRYVDCGNGTVTDTVTGLISLKQWDCLPGNSWAAANQAAAGLKSSDCGLTDKSSPGDWRLPTKAEWDATIARAVALGCVFGGSGGPPSLTNDAGTACYGTGAASSFAGVTADLFWSNTNETFPSLAWVANLSLPFGSISTVPKGSPVTRVWPVRGGAR